MNETLTQAGIARNLGAAPERDAECIQVRAVAGGDRDAFAALCRRHAPILHRFALRIKAIVHVQIE